MDDKLVRLNLVLKALDHTVNEMSGYLWEELVENMKAIPAVDAVEVVRCEKCVHFEPFRKHDGFCKISTMLNNNDFFCKYGQRREDGGNDATD